MAHLVSSLILLVAGSHVLDACNKSQKPPLGKLIDPNPPTQDPCIKFSNSIQWSHQLLVGEGRNVTASLPGFLTLIQELDSSGAAAPTTIRSPENRALPAAIHSLEDFRDIAEAAHDADNTDNWDGWGRARDWMDDWDLDSEFGRQTINGMNPTVIRRIKKIPENFPVNQSHVDGLLYRGLSLQEELESGNIYMVDFKILEGISTGSYEGRKLEMAAAMALFYHAPKTNDLLPLAIQLGQTPGPDTPIWTALDTRLDWLLAKFWFRNADAQVSQLVNQVAYTHFFLEPFAVAMLRQLPTYHPVHKLLGEHLKYIVGVNEKARAALFTPGGPAETSLTAGAAADDLIAKAFKEVTFDDFNYPENLNKRDTMDLPGYHHRDDAIQMWNVTHQYVKDLIDEFYNSNTKVSEDCQLQAWAEDVHTNGFGKIREPKSPSLGLPSLLETKEALTMYLTKIIYTATSRHAFENNYVFQYSKFAPNSPAVMRGQLPREQDRGLATLATLLNSLPSRSQAAQTAKTAKSLVRHNEPKVLSETPDWVLNGDSVERGVFYKFRDALSEVEKKIQTRNEKLDGQNKVSYTVLLPSKISSAISI